MRHTDDVDRLRTTVRGFPRRTDGRLTSVQHVPSLLGDLVGAVVDPGALGRRLRESDRCDPWLVEHKDVWWIGERGVAVDGGLVTPPDEQSPLPLPPAVLRALGAVLDEVVVPGASGSGREVFHTQRRGRSIGAHVDSEDVYTVQLHGSRTWTIDPPDLDRLRELEARGRMSRELTGSFWIPTDESTPPSWRSPRELTVRAGDLLAMPAFSLHRVVGDGPASISVNAFVDREDVWAATVPARVDGTS